MKTPLRPLAHLTLCSVILLTSCTAPTETVVIRSRGHHHRPVDRLELSGPPPKPGMVWREGRWVLRGRTWVWIPGQWLYRR